VLGDVAVHQPGTRIVCWEGDCGGSTFRNCKNISARNGRTRRVNITIAIGEIENGKIMAMQMDL